MKILLLSALNSVHTIKWANSLSESGIEVHIVGLTSYDKDAYRSSIYIYSLNFNKTVKNSDGSYRKLKYIKVLPFIRKKIKEIKPDVLHAHYASSYGLLGALCGFHPFVVSVWGSDVYDFPKISLLHKLLLKFTLFKADEILSTSEVMARETGKYVTKKIHVTPFGINTKVFYSYKSESIFSDNEIIIGTIKTLEEKYGIEYLINAFYKVKMRNPSIPLKLLIVGGGTLEFYLKKLVKDLKIDNAVYFTGRIDYKKVPTYHNMIDIYVALSILDSESFGVAIVEAQACEKPVVVSNIGGLPEVIEDNLTGFVVPSKDSDSAANAIEKLVLNKDLRVKMGIEGRRRVLEFYEWEKCVNIMKSIYKNLDFKS